MQLRIKPRWASLLSWIADRPRGSAAVATILLVMIAALIRTPVIEGSLVDQMSGSSRQLEIAREIAAATGDAATAAVIVSPQDLSIGEVFADLEALAAELKALDPQVELRSIDATRSQLLVYGLTLDQPIAALLAVLHANPQTSTLVNAEKSRFLIAISSPESLQPDVLQTLAAHAWGVAYREMVVLAGAQLEHDVAASLENDLRLLIPVIVAVTLLALFAAFRYWRALLLPFFASIASTVVTFALFSTLFIPINLLTLLALPIVLVVGLANSCHFLASSEADLDSRHDIDAAVQAALRRVGPPFFFSTVTTAIALASLGFNDLRPIVSLGLISSAALLIVFVLVLLAAPLSLRWYLSRPANSWQKSAWFAAWSRQLAAWRTHIGAVLLLAMLAAAATVPLLTVKSEPRAFFPDDATFSSALRMFEQEFYAFAPLQVLLRSNEEDALQGLRDAAALRDVLAAHDGVRQVLMSPALDTDNAYVLHALLANDAALGELRQTLDAAAMADDVSLVYSSASIVYGDIDRQAMESLLRSLGWSVALIFGFILIVFRSLRALLGAMLASAVPLLLVCGTVWLVGNPLNLVTVFVFLVALGIVVDDSIHILFWRAAGDDVAGSSIEFSVVLSTLVLCVGLLLCQLSDFPTTRQFAAYCALALVGAVISNLSVLPLMLGSVQSATTRRKLRT